MEIYKYPYGLQNKIVSKHKVDRYFSAKSLDELIIGLHQYVREGYFKLDVTLSTEYLDWENKHQEILFQTDVLNHYDPFGVMQRGKYGLSHLTTKTSLSRTEIAEVIEKLPNDMAELYLQFKLSEIDQKRLRDRVAETQSKNKRRTAYDTLKYNGLEASGAEITYLKKPIDMGFQELQVARVFLENPEKLRYKDMFTTNREIFPGDLYPDVIETLGKLVPAVHKKLRKAVGKKCIFNKRKEGWYLKIE